MKKYLFLCFVLTFFAHKSVAQKKVRFGIEAGMSFSQLPTFRTRKFSKTTDLPLTSPVLGAISQISLTKRLSLSIGLQYQQRGHIEQEISEGTNIASGAFSSDFLARSRLHEIAFPLTLTAHFNIKNVKMNGILGFRYLRNIGGYYSMSAVSTSNNVQTFNLQVSGKFFDETQFKSNANKAYYQTSLGLSFPLKSKFEISTFLNYSMRDYYVTQKPILANQIPGADYSPYYHVVSGSDLQLTCRYYFN